MSTGGETVSDADKDAGTTNPLWVRWAREPRRSPWRGRWLAEVRRGAGKEALSVPEMWPYYTIESEDSRATRQQLRAEHVCLVLYGFHQQSLEEPVHVYGTDFASALRELRSSQRFAERESALDRRLLSAITATTITGLEHHLRSLVRLLRTERLAFDYTRLFKDLIEWQRPGGPDQVRRRWGRLYYRRATSTQSTTSEKG